MLACKNSVDIEILESILVSLRTIWPLDKVKEFLDLRDDTQMRAYDFAIMRKRRDLAVVIEEFVDTTKTVLDIGFSYIEGFDFKEQAKTLYEKELNTIKTMNTLNQYMPL